MLEAQADLYSILIATEQLERAYVRDLIAPHDYTAACQKLITQYKTILASATLTDGGPGAAGPADVLAFIQSYAIHCPAAVKRLWEIGVPATIEHGAGVGGAGASSASSQAKAIADTVQVGADSPSILGR